MAKKTSKVPAKHKRGADKQTEERKPSRLLPLFAGVGILIVLVAVVWGTFFFYSQRALPNVRVGNTAVGQKTSQEIRHIIEDQQAVLQVTFVDNDKRTTVAAQDLGVVIDVDATLAGALQARRSGTVIDNLSLWQTKTVPLALKSDPGKLKAYIEAHYPSIFVNAQDAQLVYNAEKQEFTIKPGTMGKGPDIAWFESQLPDLASRPRTISLALTTQPVKPIIDDKALIEPQKVVNDHIKLPLIFTLGGATKYTAKPSDIASWTHFVPDPTAGTVRLEYDKAKVEQFLTQQVAPKVAQTPIERKVIRDSSGHETVITPGRAGQQLRNVDGIANEIIAALTAQQPLTKEIEVTTAPFKTVTITGSGKWIEIDLSKQRLTLFADNTPLNTFVISSGTARTPTPVGTFAVWHKVTSQTMTGTIAGDYFYLPNVKWVSYINGDVAIHGTYWHNNFGHPMSHGCINMTEAQAKIVYDFAPVGTKVVVHY